ncbi:MAG: DUF309 domain-containing protein [Thermoprotei archaeon]
MGAQPADYSTLSSKLVDCVAAAGVKIDVRNLRVASRLIQFDVFISSGEKPQTVIERVLQQVESEFCDVVDFADITGGVAPLVAGKERLELAYRMFAEERYWEAHDLLETLWRTERDPGRKKVLQGTILAAAAMVHAQKNRKEVALGVAARALRMIRVYKDDAKIGLEPFDVNYIGAQLDEMVSTGAVKPIVPANPGS